MWNRGFALTVMAALVAPAALAQTQAPAPAPAAQPPDAQLALRPIEPNNALEHSFVAALNNPAMRPVFRRQLLDNHVALATTSASPDAQPLEIELRQGVSTTLVFTSPERVDQVLGPQAPRIILTGRAALERLRGKNVIINARLMPMLTLEPDDVERYLEAPTAPDSAGPTQ